MGKTVEYMVTRAMDRGKSISIIRGVMTVKKNFVVTAVLGSVLCLFVCSCAELPREMMLWDDAGSPGQTLNRGTLTQAIATNCIEHIPEATLTCLSCHNIRGALCA